MEAVVVKRASNGVAVGSALAFVFGSILVITGSLMSWANDPVLGLLSKKGTGFQGITPSDGLVTLVLGILSAISLAIVFVSKRKLIALIPVLAFSITLVLAVVNIIIVSGRGILSPGRGIYMVLGGSVAGMLCSMSCYQIIADFTRDKA